MPDIDQSGLAWQTAKVWLGPTLGWVMQQVRPTQSITTGGATTLQAGASVVFVNIAALVTVNLPPVSQWVLETAYQPNTGFERALWIKDFGGNANAFNITVHPFAGDKIDNLAQDFTIIQNRQLLRLYPLIDLTGWYSG